MLVVPRPGPSDLEFSRVAPRLASGLACVLLAIPAGCTGTQYFIQTKNPSAVVATSNSSSNRLSDGMTGVIVTDVSQNPVVPIGTEFPLPPVCVLDSSVSSGDLDAKASKAETPMELAVLVRPMRKNPAAPLKVQCAKTFSGGVVFERKTDGTLGEPRRLMSSAAFTLETSSGNLTGVHKVDHRWQAIGGFVGLFAAIPAAVCGTVMLSAHYGVMPGTPQWMSADRQAAEASTCLYSSLPIALAGTLIGILDPTIESRASVD